MAGSMTLTRGLLAGAVAATLADCAVFVALIGQGYAVEVNPLVARLAPTAALGLRGLLLVGLAALTAIVATSDRAIARRFAALHLVLLIGIVIGLAGVVSTVLSAVAA